MNRKQLSSNLIAEKIVISIVALLTILLYFLLSGPIIVLPIVLTIVMGNSLYTIYYVVKNISYDSDKLFIKGKLSDKEIDFKDLIKIKITPLPGSWRKMWRINFMDGSEEFFVRFYAKYGLISVLSFIKTVKAKNPDFRAIYFTFSLDVDFD